MKLGTKKCEDKGKGRQKICVPHQNWLAWHYTWFNVDKLHDKKKVLNVSACKSWVWVVGFKVRYWVWYGAMGNAMTAWYVKMRTILINGSECVLVVLWNYWNEIWKHQYNASLPVGCNDEEWTHGWSPTCPIHQWNAGCQPFCALLLLVLLLVLE